jgi:uncharacterized protein YabN with tetrapyrrole methylase and pyrophosphatase domain
MDPISVLLANEPRAYRDTLAVALRLLRPQAAVIVTDPSTLEEDILQYDPQMVICSQLSQVVNSDVPTWVVLYPDGTLGATLHKEGENASIIGLDLAGIAALISP